MRKRLRRAASRRAGRDGPDYRGRENGAPARLRWLTQERVRHKSKNSRVIVDRFFVPARGQTKRRPSPSLRNSTRGCATASNRAWNVSDRASPQRPLPPRDRSLALVAQCVAQGSQRPAAVRGCDAQHRIARAARCRQEWRHGTQECVRHKSKRPRIWRASDARKGKGPARRPPRSALRAEQ